MHVSQGPAQMVTMWILMGIGLTAVDPLIGMGTLGAFDLMFLAVFITTRYPPKWPVPPAILLSRAAPSRRRDPNRRSLR